MARFPRIQSPCPANSRLDELFDGDFCTLCKRQVHDLNEMTDRQRVAFMDGCAEDVCVSYRVRADSIPLSRTLLPAAVAVAAVSAGVSAPASAQEPFCDIEEVIMVGGVKDPSKTEWLDVESEQDLPELPIIVDPNFADPADTDGENNV